MLLTVLSNIHAVAAYYFAAGNLIYLLVIAIAYWQSRRRFIWSDAALVSRLPALKRLTPISILIPCYNEEKSIVDSIRSMQRLDYPDFELVICNDGSKDQTMQILIDTFALEKVQLETAAILPTNRVRGIYVSRQESRFLVIDKDNGGKADALNACLNYCHHPLVCCVDSDSVLSANGLAKIATPFFAEPETTLAVGGTISIINGSETATDLSDSNYKPSIPFTYLGMVQAVEYLRAFLIGRMGWDALKCTTIISGAFGLFKKSALIKVGGYTRGSIGEDMELLLRLHSYSREHGERYRVHFLPDPVCWTETPSDFTTLGKQRSRWQQGLCDSLWRTRRLFFSRSGGLLGWFALPFLLFFELLSAPVEICCYLLIGLGFACGLHQTAPLIMLTVVTLVFGVVLNLAAVIVDQLTFYRYPRLADFAKLLLGAVLEQFGFRYLHLWWRLRGIYRFFKGSHHWGDMPRRGLQQKAPEAAAKLPKVS